MEMMISCPICGEPQKRRGLQFHLRNNHPTEFKEAGYKKLRGQAMEAPPEQPAEPAPPMEPAEEGGAAGIIPAAQREGEPMPAFTPPRTETDMKAMDSWFHRTGQKIYFTPTPIATAVINQFAKASNPSDVINKALHEYAANRGIQPAIIKTEGGEALSMLGGNNEDMEFNRLLKLMAVQNQTQQSYSQYSPVTQMMQTLRERVGGQGMSMGQFGKELMQMVFMMKVMEGV
jgi:hypothetical protein